MELKGAISDTDLIQRIRNNDRNAFRLLFNRYWESLYATALKRTKCQSSSEDIVQEVFADIWKRRDTISIHSSFKAYLFTAVKYYVYKSIQRKFQEIRLEESDVFLKSEAEATELEFRELYHILEVAVDKLPENQKLILKMSRFEGLSSTEIAKKLSLSQQTVHNNLHRSLKILRAELKDYAPLILSLLLFQ